MFNYTSRTYNTILADINSDTNLTDKPDWFKNMVAGSHDVLSLALNAAVNDLYLSTAFTEQSVDKLLQLIDYQRAARTTSSGSILFDILRTATFPVTVATADVVAYSQGSVSVSSKRFEALAGFTLASTTETGTRSGNTLTVARVYTTGELFRISGAGLPSPLVISTDYYAIYDSATSIKVAASRTDAYNGTYITLTGAGSGTIKLFSQKVTCYQQTSKTNVIVGTSDGSASFQEFNMPELDVLKTSISITINSLSWTRVDTFVNSISTDKHYKVEYKTDGSCVLVFGNGTYGLIPPAFPIYASYAIGGGTAANITVLNKINSYAGTDSNITAASNCTTFSGGADREAIAVSKRLAPILLKTRDRFVTVEDGESLVLNYGGIQSASIDRNYYGVLSCRVVIVPTGGGAPAGALVTALQNYLIDRTILESIDVVVIGVSYVNTAFTSSLHVKTGYVYATVKPFYELGILMSISEKSQEIKTYLLANGIASTITLINTYWYATLGYAFTSADYTQVSNIVTYSTAPTIGGSIYEPDVVGVLDQWVDGVDYFTITLPAAFPVSFASNQISHEGAITTTSV
jgi:hypothetical protein